MNTLRKVYVYVQDVFAGELFETDEGYCFSYDEKYFHDEHALPVSLTLPLSKQLYTSKILFPFFDGLIPEGWLLEIVTRNWKLEYKDRFGLLTRACKDSIGTVSIREEKV